MSDSQTTGVREPTIKTRRRAPSIVWLIPLVTLCIGLWLVVKTISGKGPEITISFKTAEGIKAGKTVVKYKNVQIGMVESLRFSKRFDHIVLSVRMDPEAKVFLHRDTQFWVVRPHLSLRGISGLGTLVSGAYIDIAPGHGSVQYHFVGLDEPPAVNSDADGRRITLLAEKLGSLEVGSPIYYQGIQAGEVLGYELANDQHSVFVYAFIKAPYDELVHGNSHFWNVSGVDVSVGADGFQVHTPSLLSLIYGGIAFDSQKAADSPDEDVSSLIFSLYDNYDQIIEKAYTHKLRFVAFFDQSVRGLAVGAPVEFKGIKVGHVADVRLEFNSKDSSFLIPVVLDIEPERIINRNKSETKTKYQILQTLVKLGLRAQLQTGSLLTGKMFVALDMHPHTPIKLVHDARSALPEIPTIAGGFNQITTSIQSILDKLNKVHTDKIGAELEAALHGANKLMNAPELAASVGDLRVSLHAFRHIVEALDKHSGSMANNLDKVLDAGQKTLKQANKTLAHLNVLLDPSSPTQYRLNQLIRDLSDMSHSIRSFVDLLERHPNAVILGKPTGD